MKKFFRWLIRMVKAQPGDWMKNAVQPVQSGKGKIVPIGEGYNPDKEFEDVGSTAIESPIFAFNRDLMEGKVEIAEAWLWEGIMDQRGKLLADKSLMEASEIIVPWRTRYVSGNRAYKEALRQAERSFRQLPAKAAAMQEAKAKYLEGVKKLKAAGILKEDSTFAQDPTPTSYDLNQYTEYTPSYGGPFNKQLYLTDYLRMHALAFEAKNHNPVAKRVIDLLAQYSFGRRFKVRIKDKRKKKAWDDFEKEHNIIHRCSEFWIREYLTYGELMLNKDNWQSIDPSTVWDIITDPDDITKVYYYYQSYPTAFQTFTGYKVKGEPGSANQPGMKYIVRQIPASQVIHIKGNVVSQEKRGRSVLFPILGWLKRIKDLYSAEVQRAQLQATFLWDDTISGSDADVQAYAAKFASMPLQMSVYIHNEQVKRQAMPALQGGDRASLGVGDEILAFIATSIGIPKDFFNIIATGGGNRATALVGAEPFEKVIEDLQAKFENLLLAIAEEVMEDAGLDYEKGDVEFIFPSVTKDTTTETIKNVATLEDLEYIAHETGAEMAAAEMNITGYDYDEEQKKIQDRREEKMDNDPLDPSNGSSQLQLPLGVVPSLKKANGNGNGSGANGVVGRKDNPLHGKPKSSLKAQLNNL